MTTDRSPHTPASIRIGTRGSALARWQTDHVSRLLAASVPDLSIDLEVFTTQGDRNLSLPLPEVGGKGLFTAELEAALLGGRIDVAVHSLKDLPTETPGGLTVGAIPRRTNPADALVSGRGYTVAALPKGATVGTSSPRRASQLLHIRPDLKILDIRGNVDTRIRKAHEKAGPYDAVVLAYAGLERLGRLDVVTDVFDFGDMLPAPGQGALGVQCRDEGAIHSLVRSINDDDTEIAVAAERAFLTGLGGGCALPICALGLCEGGRLSLRGRVLSPDGANRVDVAGETRSATPETARELGERLAQEALARGAGAILGNAS